MINHLKNSDSRQWYSKSKRMTSYSKNNQDFLLVDEICHLDVQELAEILAENFSSVSNVYGALQNGDITLPPFDPSSLPFSHQKTYIPTCKKID